MSKKYVLIIGTYDDIPTMYVADKVIKRGGNVVIFDTTKFPSETIFTFDENSPCEGFFQAGPKEEKIPLSNIQSVYRRWSKGISAPVEEDPLLSEIVYWNIESAIGAFCRCLDCQWVNSAEATDMHKYKGYQLKLMKQSGIRIPKTIITNDPEEVMNFYEKQNRNVIFKPVRGWAHTEKLSVQDLTHERLATLSRSPIKLQECIPGRDIRVYLVKDEIFAMEIQSETLDFREQQDAPRVPIVLPESVQEDCRKVAKILDLIFTGIDMRRTPEGEYVFFEANPTPVFIYDEQCSGYPVSDRIVDILLS